MRYICLFLMLMAPLLVQGQTASTLVDIPAPIEDNSFFVEEAFNQEKGVVQHIFNGVYFRRPIETAAATFTQEWPIGGAEHQFSYTIAYSLQHSPGFSGFGDTYLNYRYQLLTEDAWAACAPRLSLILPTGNQDKGLGFGVVGAQINIPFSKRVSRDFFVHWNAGATLFPNVKSSIDAGRAASHSLSWYNLSTSVIWLANPNVNVMLEAVANFTSQIDEEGDVSSSKEFIINPGLRFAINLPQLQIVPGVAVPFSFLEGETRIGALLYLSFEHPF
jgi:hypothetical protein